MFGSEIGLWNATRSSATSASVIGRLRYTKVLTQITQVGSLREPLHGLHGQEWTRSAQLAVSFARSAIYLFRAIRAVARAASQSAQSVIKKHHARRAIISTKRSNR
jgi:hypothetical protein